MNKFELEKKLFNFKVVGGTLGHPVYLNVAMEVEKMTADIKES